MATKIHAQTITGIAPGKTVTGHWNNATPRDAVWYVQAIPKIPSFQKGSYDLQVEVTRVWRRLTVWCPNFPKHTPSTTEDEIYYEIQNVGSEGVDVEVYVSVIT